MNLDVKPKKRNLEKHTYPTRKFVRLKDYDYSSDGYYFVTICSHKKQANLGGYKNILKKILLGLPLRFPELGIDYYVVMATHLHIIFVFSGVKTTLGKMVRSFKALASREIGARNLWQRNYYEHVIRNEKVLTRIRKYIQNNPSIEKMQFKQFYDSGLDKSSPYKKTRVR